MFYALYWRYGSMFSADFDTIDEAVSILMYGADAGELSHVGIYDSNAKVLYNVSGLYTNDAVVRVLKEMIPDAEYTEIIKKDMRDWYEELNPDSD